MKTYKRRTSMGLCGYCGGTPDTGFSSCTPCRQEHNSKYLERKAADKEKYNALSAINNRRARAKNAELVFEHYGRVCSCPGCGETEPKFLTIDHVNNDGAAHRRSISGDQQHGNMWLEAKKLGFPDWLQILCYNCNMGKARNGGICPHHEMEYELDAEYW